MQRLKCLFGTLFAGLALVQGAKATEYTFQMLTAPAGFNRVSFNGLNDAGTLVGSYTDSSGMGHGFIDNAGQFTTYDFCSGCQTALSAISNSGILTGSLGISSLGFIDNHGTTATFGSGVVPIFGGPVSIGPRGVNDSGEAVGLIGEKIINETFVLGADGTFSVVHSLPLPGFRPDIGWGFNGVDNAGDIVGRYGYLIQMNPGLAQVGFVETAAGVFTVLNGPATGINNLGEIVGDDDPNVDGNAYIYQNGSYTSFSAPAALSTSLFSVNDAGEVLGSYFPASCDPNQVCNPQYFLATPETSSTPEPATWLLLGAGLAAFAWCKRAGHL